MKINDIITALLGTAVAGLGTMVITIYQDRGSQREINKKIEAAIIHLEEEFEADLAKLVGGMTNRFTSAMGQVLEDRQWDIVQRLAILEAKIECEK